MTGVMRNALVFDDAGTALEVHELRALRVSRLRRELNSIIRRGEVVAIERKGKLVAKLLPVTSFAERLASMPNVGDDEDFAREQ